MQAANKTDGFSLSVIVPCFNEEHHLQKSIERLVRIQDDTMRLEIIIVDDFSSDASGIIAAQLSERHDCIRILRHTANKGKGAAIKTGLNAAAGDFIAIHDADLEYDPEDLRKLLVPLIQDKADVVMGSRFLSCGSHRVLYFWHYVGNKFLTLLSNMLTDLNLTDMETCYKVFKNDVIKKIDIQEERFGFEPEIVAKIAHLRVRIFESGISYYGRTYAEGKKIGIRDGWRALYCILKYNIPKAPVALQFFVYSLFGIASSILNASIFVSLLALNLPATFSIVSAFSVSAIINYSLSIRLLFRRQARWNRFIENGMNVLILVVAGGIDWATYFPFDSMGLSPYLSKLGSALVAFSVIYLSKRFIVFPESTSPDW